MESDLNTILSRINFKLDCYTSDNHFEQPRKISKDYKSRNDINIQYQSNHSKHIQSQKQISNMDFGAYNIRRNKNRNDHLNQEQEMSGEKNKNKNLSYQQFRASRSNQKTEQPILKKGLENPRLQHHEQAFLRIKSKNQTLQTEVQILSAKLKEIEKSLEKGNIVQNKKFSREESQNQKKIKRSKCLNNKFDQFVNLATNKNIQRKIVNNNNKICSWIPNGTNTNHKICKNNILISRSTDNLHHQKCGPKRQIKNIKNLEQGNLKKTKFGSLSIQTSLDQIPLSQKILKSCKHIENGSKKAIQLTYKVNQNCEQNKYKNNNKCRQKSMQSLPETHKMTNSKSQKNKIINIAEWNKKLNSSKGNLNIDNLRKQNQFFNLKTNNSGRKKVKKQSRVIINQRKLH